MITFIVACDDDGGKSAPTEIAPTEQATAVLTTEPTVKAGCPGDWTLLETGDYVICHPADHAAGTSTLDNGIEVSSIRLIAGEPVAQTPFTLTLLVEEMQTVPGPCVFDAETVDPTAVTSVAPFEVAGTTVDACTATTSYATQFKATVPLEEGGLRFMTNAADDDQLVLAKDMLATLQIRTD